MRIAYLGERWNCMEAKHRRPVGRPKKTLSKVVEQNMRKLSIMKDMAEDRQEFQPQEWETRDVKQR